MVGCFPIIEAMLHVPREVFVPAEKRQVAYAGEHIALGGGRFALDPRVFAKMLDALDIGPDELVLDIGCGLGYSAAVIARMAEAVIAVEADEAMASEAEANLMEQSVDNTVVVAGDLAGGAAQHGPYDAVVIEGGIETLPDAIVEQLREGGRIAAIFVEGSAGQCRVGVKRGGSVYWHVGFDATAPGLPGFAREVEFAL